MFCLLTHQFLLSYIYFSHFKIRIRVLQRQLSQWLKPILSLPLILLMRAIRQLAMWKNRALQNHQTSPKKSNPHSRMSGYLTDSSWYGFSLPWRSGLSWVTSFPTLDLRYRRDSLSGSRSQSVRTDSGCITCFYILILRFSAVGLLVMMYPILCKVRYETLHRVFQTRRVWIQIGFSIFFNWIIAPFFMVSWSLPMYPRQFFCSCGIHLVGASLGFLT
jgi:hypothetical protein